ncbi:MAG: MotA/TolQ/ExbB proton channel family protein [Thermodesulfovibrionales bacterium]
MNVIITILGILIVIGLLLTIFKGVSLSTFFNWEAIIIIFGGTACGLLLSYPIERLKDTISTLKKAFNTHNDRDTTIENILTISRLYRKSEIKSLERLAGCMDNGFLKLSVYLLINNHKTQDIKTILEREMNTRIISLHSNQNVLKTGARLAPSLGLAGTVISLIKMFSNMTTIEAMMPMMAVALMSTFYGVIFSNLLFMPLSVKIKDMADAEEAEMLTIIEGIVSIANGEHTLKIEERLRNDWINGEEQNLAVSSHLSTAVAKGRL